ncbi:MAG: hypothetical protein H0Z34_17855 [Brevibacillus sp.]|nr:hypothetical protein [Brevibacillus sp.]
MGRFFALTWWPTSEEAVQDRFTTIRRGSGKTTSRCRRAAVAAAISLRIRRFAGRLAKPFAGEKTARTRHDALFAPRQRV